MKQTETLMIGERFTYKGIEWICLDIIDGNFLAITAEVWQELPFDTNNYNNWKESSLRRVLNSEFLELLDKSHLVMQTSDLIADNGDKMYGTCEDLVTILSCDQYRKYREIVPHYPEWMWTLTPWNCSPNAGVARYARIVYPSGYIYNRGAYSSLGVAPACLFSSEHLTLCRQAHLVEKSEVADTEEDEE